MDYVGRLNTPLAVGPWPIFAADGFTTVPGEADDTDWTLYRNGDVYAVKDGVNDELVVVAELVAKPGRYKATYTPREPGNYTLEVRHPGANGGTAVHFEAVIRVDSVTLTEVGGFAVVPLLRGVSPTGEIVEFRVRFVLPDGTAFDPYELRKVEIRDAATDRLLFVVGAADIEGLGDGIYRVFSPLVIGQPITLRDRWYFRAFDGTETIRDFVRVVAEPVAVDDLLITVERLKRNETGGDDHLDGEGNPYPDQTYIEMIQGATAELAGQCDIVLKPTQFIERHDYRIDHYMEFGWFELDKRPVAEIVAVRARWPNGDTLFDIPPDWIVNLSPNFAQFNLVPQSGPLHTALAQNARGIGLMIPGMNSYWPGLFEVTYRAGFDVGKVPAHIQKAIALLAAIDFYNLSGEQVMGSGLQGWSIGVGGLSQSVTTTNSSTNAGHGAAILEFRRTLKILVGQIRQQYHGVSIGCG